MWNGHPFYKWRRDQLLKLIRLLGSRTYGLYLRSKVELCGLLNRLRPNDLVRRELRAVELIQRGGSLDEARQILSLAETQSDHEDTDVLVNLSDEDDTGLLFYSDEEEDTIEPRFHTTLQPRDVTAQPITTYSRGPNISSSESQGRMVCYPRTETGIQLQTDILSIPYPRTAQAEPSCEDLVPSLSTRTCQTCTEEKHVDHFAARTIDSGCKHTSFNNCTTCLSEYIQAQSDVAPLDQIVCPEARCNNSLTYLQMKQHAPVALFERYDTYISLRTIQGSVDYVKCANKSCDTGGIVDESTTSFLVCPECGTRTCFTCKTEDHPNISHHENKANVRRLREQSEERLQLAMRKVEEEEHTVRTVEKVTKPCPNEDCGVKITKDGGCNHMTCMSGALP